MAQFADAFQDPIGWGIPRDDRHNVSLFGTSLEHDELLPMAGIWVHPEQNFPVSYRVFYKMLLAVLIVRRKYQLINNRITPISWDIAPDLLYFIPVVAAEIEGQPTMSFAQGSLVFLANSDQFLLPGISLALCTFESETTQQQQSIALAPGDLPFFARIGRTTAGFQGAHVFPLAHQRNEHGFNGQIQWNVFIENHPNLIQDNGWLFTREHMRWGRTRDASDAMEYRRMNSMMNMVIMQTELHVLFDKHEITVDPDTGRIYNLTSSEKEGLQQQIYRSTFIPRFPRQNEDGEDNMISNMSPPAALFQYHFNQACAYWIRNLSITEERTRALVWHRLEELG
ncbi:hypothetical protein SISSUDRAFT_1036380 [Sistotremastrum suecicum HHB10207 ss-3]|uniref:HNH nuclease domain-containing protein n=1 Tax=Sistotremastrum suecicum HHB10207 ss-3 TaxID=1314776 RepID=A0A165ZI61_9AGAM|nr:hypothetical protein SISSUDRAFT_1036380 [Sistotremastrum suecicum HHB10207 ss-3]